MCDHKVGTCVGITRENNYELCTGTHYRGLQLDYLIKYLHQFHTTTLLGRSQDNSYVSFLLLVVHCVQPSQLVSVSFLLLVVRCGRPHYERQTNGSQLANVSKRKGLTSRRMDIWLLTRRNDRVRVNTYLLAC